ncbi:MAG: pimeloyl-ACP methyl ester carboxylesterase [Saprospiraceae bacterium]|jgi:pimeloyl-ACP methyl ester carboxylesterase
MNKLYVASYLLLLSIFSLSHSEAQSIDCTYPIIFIHGFTGSQESFDGVYTDPNFVACYGDLTDTYHAVLNATSSSNIWGADGLQGTSDDDVLLSFNNETNDLAPGCVYTINFNNYWNEDEANPEIDINGCSSPGAFESDSNESAILKGGYALGDMIQKVLVANPGKEKVILVGHSMGGLTSREYLQRTVNNNNSSAARWWVDPGSTDGHKVIKLATTSTPHLGSNFFGNPWPFTDPDAAETRDGLPDISSEATRDLRYSYSLGCGFLGLESCPGAYLFGGEEDDIWGYWNEDVDCDGDESSIIVGINEAGFPDEWDGTKDNWSMPLPMNLRYTWLTNDILLDSGDGVVAWDRQWLYTGSTPEPSDGTAYRLTDTILTDYSHLNANSDANVVIRGLDEGDYPLFAWQVQLDNLMGGLVQVRSADAPEGNNNTDPDWFMIDIPVGTTGNLRITFNPHPSLSGQIDYFNNSPGDYEAMTANGDHQSIFTAGNPTIVLTIPEVEYTPGGTQYFRVMHNNVGYADWHLHYDFELTIDAPLPVEFVSFTGQKMDDQVELNWTTSSEYNSHRFEIMRAFNGLDFETIGEIDAAGFSDRELQYSFFDSTPLAGNNYYRLRQIDADGKVCYSNIVILYFEQEVLNLYKIYPNPTRNRVTVDYFTYSDETTFFNVYNMVGQLIRSEQFDVAQGNNSTSIHIGDLLNGVYLLEIRQGKIGQRVRIAKQ